MKKLSITATLSGLAVILAAALMFAPVASYAAEPSVETPQQKFQDDLSKRSLQQEQLRKRSMDQFLKMCEFIELDGAQLEKARKLFDSRIEEMTDIFEASRKGKVDQKQARDRLSESFAQHRDKFEALLDQEQKAKLELWEKHRSQSGEKSGRS